MLAEGVYAGGGGGGALYAGSCEGYATCSRSDRVLAICNIW